ncbi:MAG: glycosyltransferase family 4 protein [Candidatus Sumerlaeaceae bacterium]
MLRTALTYLINDPEARRHTIVGLLPTVIVPLTISMLGVIGSILVSQQYKIMARPTARGSHTVPTPRLGGVGAAIGFYAAALLISPWIPVAPSAWYTALLVGGCWALVGGVLDDVFELPPRWKTLVQLAAAFSPIALGYWPSTLALPLFKTLTFGFVAGSILLFLFVMLMMNAVNFMDGMDGHAALFGIVTAATIGLFLFWYGFWYRALEYGTAIALASCVLGLLLFNYPGRPLDSKTFMGDGGSQFIGFALAILSLRAAEGAHPARFPLIASLILYSPFIFDVAYTMLLRFRRGEDLRHAHREHLYQRLMVAGWSHGKTLMFNLGLWLIMAAIAFAYARAAMTGRGEAQLLLLVLTGVVLFGYTQAVGQIEREQARSRTT